MKIGSLLNHHLSVKKSTSGGLPSTKKIVSILLLVLLACILLVGCEKPINRFKEKSTVVIDSCEDRKIDFSLGVVPFYPEEMRREDMIVYSVTNNSDRQYETGPAIDLEYLYDDEWYIVPAGSGPYHRTGDILYPEGKKEYTAVLQSYTASGLQLPEGHYRMIKQFSVKRTNDSTEDTSFKVCLEFDYPLPGKYRESKDKEIDVDELVESTIEVTPLEDLNMEISYEGDSNGHLSFSITNNSDIDYLGGDTYHLEYYNNDKWYSVPFRPRMAFTMVGKMIQKGTTRDFKINLTVMHYILPDGHYRVVKNIMDDREHDLLPGERKRINIAFEFDYPF